MKEKKAIRRGSIYYADLDPVRGSEQGGNRPVLILQNNIGNEYTEFERVYEPIKAYNDFQHNWIIKRMNGSIDDYISFIKRVKATRYPVKVRFGLEVCYIPETADILTDILDKYDFDFLTGAVHWIDGWGFDHMGQKEIYLR